MSRGFREPPLLPPRKRDWTSGTVQLGLFIRTENGAVVQSSWKQASAAQRDAALALLNAPGGEPWRAPEAP